MKKIVSVLTLIACLSVAAFAAEIPRKAADLVIPLPDGKQARLSDYHGKVVIVAFILTT